MDKQTERPRYPLRSLANYQSFEKNDLKTKTSCNQQDVALKEPRLSHRQFGTNITSHMNNCAMTQRPFYIPVQKKSSITSESVQSKDNQNTQTSFNPKKLNFVRRTYMKQTNMSIEYPDPQLTVPYQNAILRNVRILNWSAKQLNQQEINDKMWMILSEWIIYIHQSYGLQDETLYKAFGIINLYLEKKQLSKANFQLLGVCALGLACKYHENTIPIQDFIKITDNCYTYEQILNFEAEVLITLQFNVSFPTQIDYFDLYELKAGISKKHRLICKYILELSLIDPRMKEFSLELVAVSTIYMVKYLNKLPDYLMQSPFDEKTIKNCALQLVLIFQQQDPDHKMIKKKYASEKYMHVSDIQIENQ